MSVKIVSGAAANVLTVDPTSLAARGTLYDSAGKELYPVPTGAYMLAIVNGRQTVAATAAGMFFAMRNSLTGVTLYIRRVTLTVGFDGAPVATTSRWDLAKFAGATPSGGTSISLPGGAIKKRTTYGSSNLLDARYITGTAGGLTTTNITVETAIDSMGVPRGTAFATATYIREFGDAGAHVNDRFEIAPGEGLCIVAGITGVVGDSFQGSVEWDEL
jgi:hypothetical protein